MAFAVEFRGIEKRFGGVRALEGVTLAVACGECHALCGENGAGKSTLARILSGVLAPDAGELWVEGAPQRFRSTREALACGIAMVHQELTFCPQLSAAENLFLGRSVRRPFGAWSRRAAAHGARARLADLGCDIDVDAPLAELAAGEAQMVAIAAALDCGARVLIFDEPTCALSQHESERLFARVKHLRAAGTTVIWVSHRLCEVRALADRISVLRDGRWIATFDREEATEERLVQAMIGRPLAALEPRHRAQPCGVSVLSVVDLRTPRGLCGVSFEVRRGEVLGIAGLVGSGRSALAPALAGIDSAARGRVRVRGRELELGEPRAAHAAGIALVPEDRARSGLLPGASVRENWALPLRGRSWRWLDREREVAAARASLASLAIRCGSLEDPVTTLSGGNQQKLLLARALASGAEVLILDEPTRGIDVGTQAMIRARIDALALEGKAVLLISSELAELQALATRVLVLRDGVIAAELAHADASEERLVRAMAGVSAAGSAV